MRTNNPVLNNLPAASQGANAYGQQGQTTTLDNPFQQQSTDRPMTVDDVVTKTGITLAVIIVFAVANFALGTVNPGAAMMLTLVGGIAGFITVLVHAFSARARGPVTTLIYAVFEGLFVGGISLMFSGALVGGADAGTMIGQAVLGTIGVFLGMLFVYKTGAIRVTPKFTRFITAAIIGVAVLAVGNLIMAMFFDMNPLRDGGPLAIIFSVVCIGLAALSFLQDFDMADKMIRAGAPSKMAWSVALGLAVTLVWLYTEILRLLSYFRN